MLNVIMIFLKVFLSKRSFLRIFYYYAEMSVLFVFQFCLTAKLFEYP